MNPTPFKMRRGTIEDLAGLRSLWAQANLPVSALEKTLTKFQVAEAPDGSLIACAGLQVEEQQGRIHSLCYAHSENRAALEQAVWDRLLSMARSHGLWRLWTQDPHPVWHARGFQKADAGLRGKLPQRFVASEGPWLVLKLRDEVSPALLVEAEFDLFKQAQQDWTEKALRQARVLRVFALVIAAMLLMFALWLLWRLRLGLAGPIKP